MSHCCMGIGFALVPSFPMQARSFNSQNLRISMICDHPRRAHARIAQDNNQLLWRTCFYAPHNFRDAPGCRG